MCGAVQLFSAASTPADIDGVTLLAHVVKLWVCDRQQVTSSINIRPCGECDSLTSFDFKGVCVCWPAIFTTDTGTPDHDFTAQG